MRMHMWSRKAAIMAALAAVMAMVLVVAVEAAGPTYSSDTDFDGGILVNVHHDAPTSDQLQLYTQQTGTFPFIWVAASDRGTITRTDTVMGVVKGEYWSSPNGMQRNPSRTTVDLDGNVWAGNRNEAGGGKGSVVKIGLIIGGTRVDSNGNPDANGQYLKGPFAYNECDDRHLADGSPGSDGLIKTSMGLGNILPWPNTGGVDSNGGVQTAEDECIINYVRVNGDNVRHVSVDADNNVWVGGYNDQTFDLVKGTDGTILATFDIDCGGYGGLVDGNGVLWSSGRRTGLELLRYDTKNTITTSDDTWSCYQELDSYGLGIDSAGNIWHARYDQNNIDKRYPDGTKYAGFPKTTYGADGDRGVAVTLADDNVWVANSWGRDVSRLDNNGNLVKVITLTWNGPDGIAGTGDDAACNSGNSGWPGPTGVAVDAAGKVWATCYGSSNMVRIDPAAGSDGKGEVDLIVSLGSGAGPYNYSDMTGAVALGSTARTGFWRVLHDEGTAGIQWTSVDWNAETPYNPPHLPAGSTLTVEACAFDSPATSCTLTPMVSGGPVSLMGQFVDVKVSFAAPGGVDSPILTDITLHKMSTAIGIPYAPQMLLAALAALAAVPLALRLRRKAVAEA